MHTVTIWRALPPAVRWNSAMLSEFTEEKIMDFLMPYWERPFGRERSWRMWPIALRVKWFAVYGWSTAASLIHQSAFSRWHIAVSEPRLGWGGTPAGPLTARGQSPWLAETE